MIYILKKISIVLCVNHKENTIIPLSKSLEKWGSKNCTCLSLRKNIYTSDKDWKQASKKQCKDWREIFTISKSERCGKLFKIIHVTAPSWHFPLSTLKLRWKRWRVFFRLVLGIFVLVMLVYGFYHQEGSGNIS